MTLVPFAFALERTMPFLLFALYLITSVQICRYSAWRQSGAPNPFLPRRIKGLVRGFENRYRLQAAA